MPTPWFYPNTVTQYAEVDSHIAWSGEETGFSSIKSNNGDFLITKKELLHIANSNLNDLKMKTYFLHLSNFKIISLPEVPSGIEVELEMRRGGRITDETMQLMYADINIGDNQASYKLDANTIYGSSTNTWGVDLTKTMLQDDTFGISVRFQSHPNWPHRESPKINYIRLRVW
jgi:hypothetical protein